LAIGLATSFLGMDSSIIVKEPTNISGWLYFSLVLFAFCSILAFLISRTKRISDFFDHLTTLPCSEYLQDKKNKQ
jgi:hypothetical protein